MKFYKFLGLIFVIVFLVSCKNIKPNAGKTPNNMGGKTYKIDLVPITPESTNYCRKDDRGFIMLFQNSGGLKSPEIEGRIIFEGNIPITFIIPEIPEKIGDTNGSTEVIVQIPNGCFNPDCWFTIQWLSRSSIKGVCIG